jgi:hypothetical protein
MKIEYNIEFKELCASFNIPLNFQFDLEFPEEVKLILQDEIIENRYGVRLSKNGSAHPPDGYQDLNKSQAEDSNNHFHVDLYQQGVGNEGIFRLGIKTILELAQKFKNRGFEGIRFVYSFQSADIRKKWNQKHGFDERDDELFISDRLSFYKIRPEEIVHEFDADKRKFEAVLQLEI